LSSVAASMYFPFGENFTNETGGLSSSGKDRHGWMKYNKTSTQTSYRPASTREKCLRMCHNLIS